MTNRDIAIAKLQQLSEPLFEEVSDFIDFVIHKHQIKLSAPEPDTTSTQAWSQWFAEVDHLDVSHV